MRVRLTPLTVHVTWQKSTLTSTLAYTRPNGSISPPALMYYGVSIGRGGGGGGGGGEGVRGGACPAVSPASEAGGGGGVREEARWAGENQGDPREPPAHPPGAPFTFSGSMRCFCRYIS